MVSRGQHDEAALGARDLDGRIEHQGQHLVQHAAGTQCPQPLEQRGELAQIADRGDRRPLPRGGCVADHEDDVGAGGAPELEPVATHQLVLGDLRLVDEGAVTRAPVPQQEPAGLAHDLGVVARHVTAGQADVVLGPAANGQLRLVERDHPPPKAVVQFEPCVSHMGNTAF